MNTTGPVSESADSNSDIPATNTAPAGVNPAGVNPASATGPQRGKAVLRTGLSEIQQAASQTGQQVKRLGQFAQETWKQSRHQRQTQNILAKLGQRLFELGLGDAALREQFQQLDERILNLQAAKSSTRRLDAERRGLQIRLAESVLQSPPPAEAAQLHGQAVQAVSSLREQQQQLAGQRAALLPGGRPDRLRVACGILFVALLGLLLLWLVRPGIGLGPSLGPRSGELLGEWTGTHEMNVVGLKYKFGYNIEFRKDGRVRWESKVLEDTSGMTDMAKKMIGDSSDSNLGTGKWRVDQVEKNVFSVRVVSDLEPDETKAFGWRVTLDTDKQMTIVNFDDVPLKLARE